MCVPGAGQPDDVLPQFHHQHHQPGGDFYNKACGAAGLASLLHTHTPAIVTFKYKVSRIGLLLCAWDRGWCRAGDSDQAQ